MGSGKDAGTGCHCCRGWPLKQGVRVSARVATAASGKLLELLNKRGIDWRAEHDGDKLRIAVTKGAKGKAAPKSPEKHGEEKQP
jgi:hypothetical protein